MSKSRKTPHTKVQSPVEPYAVTAVDVPEWHLEELRRRMETFERDRDSAIDYEVFKTHMEKKLGIK